MSKTNLFFLSTNRSDFSFIFNLIEETVKFHQDRFLPKVIFIKNENEYKEFNKKNILKKSCIYNLNSNLSKNIQHLIKIYTRRNFVSYTFVIGDRKEMLLYSNFISFLNSKIIHIGGGENTPFSPDQINRKMISLISDIHFCSTSVAKKRIKDLTGSKKIYQIGVSSYQTLNNMNISKKIFLEKKFNINLKDICLFCYHSETNNLEKELKFLKKVFRLLIKYNQKIVITSSNEDFNGKLLNEYYKKIKHRDLIYLNNLGFEDYKYFLKNCKFIIGNTSSGIVESSLFNKISINLGNRQNGRECDKNVYRFSFNLNKLENFFISGNQNKKLNYKNKIYKKMNSTKIILNKLISNL